MPWVVPLIMAAAAIGSTVVDAVGKNKQAKEQKKNNAIARSDDEEMQRRNAQSAIIQQRGQLLSGGKLSPIDFGNIYHSQPAEVAMPDQGLSLASTLIRQGGNVVGGLAGSGAFDSKPTAGAASDIGRRIDALGATSNRLEQPSLIRESPQPEKYVSSIPSILDPYDPNDDKWKRNIKL